MSPIEQSARKLVKIASTAPRGYMVDARAFWEELLNLVDLVEKADKVEAIDIASEYDGA